MSTDGHTTTTGLHPLPEPLPEFLPPHFPELLPEFLPEPLPQLLVPQRLRLRPQPPLTSIISSTFNTRMASPKSVRRNKPARRDADPAASSRNNWLRPQGSRSLEKSDVLQPLTKALCVQKFATKALSSSPAFAHRGPHERHTKEKGPQALLWMNQPGCQSHRAPVRVLEAGQ